MFTTISGFHVPKYHVFNVQYFEKWTKYFVYLSLQLYLTNCEKFSTYRLLFSISFTTSSGVFDRNRYRNWHLMKCYLAFITFQNRNVFKYWSIFSLRMKNKYMILIYNMLHRISCISCCICSPHGFVFSLWVRNLFLKITKWLFLSTEGKYKQLENKNYLGFLLS